MGLEALEIAAASSPDPELADMNRRFWGSLALSLPVVALGMAGRFGSHDLVPPHLSILLQCVFATPAVLWAGWPLLLRGWGSVVRRHLNMFSLVALGMSVTYLYSLAATFVPGTLPAGFHDIDGSVPVFFDSATIITVLMLLEQVLELRAREQTGGTIAAHQLSRAPMQRVDDVVASYFVPGVILMAALSFVAWALWGPPPSIAYALMAAVSVLIAACPSALGLATRMSIRAAIQRGAAAGIVIRSPAALEGLASADTLVVDKTGTLTEGSPRVIAVVVAPGTSEDTALSLAASLELASQDPLATATVRAARDHSLQLHEATGVSSLRGKGSTGTVQGQSVAVGNDNLMEELGVELGALAAEAETRRQAGATALFLAVDGKAAAAIAIADAIKPTTPEALDYLHSCKVRVVMVTGEHPATAAAVARYLGIDDVLAGMLPDERPGIVRQLRQGRHFVVAAGDSVKDALVLAEADVGIVLGSVSDAAAQGAGIVVVDGDLKGIARAWLLDRVTMRNIRQNLAFAAAYNITAVPAAAGALYLCFGLPPDPVAAALATLLCSLVVITNALRLRKLEL